MALEDNIMNNKKVVVLGGGVLGTQIGLMCAYYGYDTTFWLRSESSVGRTQPKIERYSALIVDISILTKSSESISILRSLARRKRKNVRISSIYSFTVFSEQP
jgi:3-hydroxyacyl-CoA dehydrogenase